MRSRGGWSFHTVRSSFSRPNFNNKYEHGSRDHQRHRRPAYFYYNDIIEHYYLEFNITAAYLRCQYNIAVGYTTYFYHSTRRPVIIILWRRCRRDIEDRKLFRACDANALVGLILIATPPCGRTAVTDDGATGQTTITCMQWILLLHNIII